MDKKQMSIMNKLEAVQVGARARRDVDTFKISSGIPAPPDGVLPEEESEYAASAFADTARDLNTFLKDLCEEMESASELFSISPLFKMAQYLVSAHLEGRMVTPSALIAASGVPYATATRRLKDLSESGLIEQRPRTKTGKTYSLHPSQTLLDEWTQMTGRIARLAANNFGNHPEASSGRDYYFGNSYLSAHPIPPLQVLPEPLRAAGGIKVLVHSDPTFMVMDNLKRQFEQVIGNEIHQRAFSIDRLHEEVLKNAERKASRYDIVAIDLPWLGEFVEKGALLPIDEVLDLERLDPADFHTAGWQAAHWGGRAYGVPAQTTPELLFYRRDILAEAGMEPPRTTDQVLEVARHFHAPGRNRYGIAWNAARGTALGHTFLMAMADFGKPVLDLSPIAGGFGTSDLNCARHKPQIHSDAGLAAAHYLKELLDYSPPYILSMSWYERIRPYATGAVPLAYGYTLLAPYFELDKTSPACGQTGYLPHPTGPGAYPIAPVGGYIMGVPANLAPERRQAAAEALIVFTSAQAQKLYIQNGSRTNPRYSVGADPELRRLSPIFEAIDGMSWRDELQFWPRPPVPQISEIIQICGEEFHDMLRGVCTPEQAVQKAHDRAEVAMNRQS